MGRKYRVPFTAVAVTAQQDLLEILCASGKMVRLLELHLSQSTEVGDAQEEGLDIRIKTGATVTGSGGSTVTAIPQELGDAAFAGTCKANNTTPAGTGTIVTHAPENWNIRIGFDRYYPPEAQIAIGANRLCVSLLTTPADSITMSGYAVIEEIG